MNYPAASYGVSPTRKQILRSKLRGIEPGREIKTACLKKMNFPGGKLKG